MICSTTVIRKVKLQTMDTSATYRIEDTPEWMTNILDRVIPFTIHDTAIVRWTEMARAVTDIHQLYHLYLWNLRQLLEGVRFSTNDQIIALRDNGTAESGRIIVNGYVMNVISYGVNLIESLRGFAKHEKQRGFTDAQRFEQVAKDEFDSNILYAIMSGLRNYAQHGQLLVSLYCGEYNCDRACFDLHQLSEPFLIKKRSLIIKKIQFLINQIEAEGSSPARLSLTYCIDSFNLSVHSLYSQFLRIFQTHIEDCAKLVNEKYKCEPRHIAKTPDNVSISILLDEDSTAHLHAGEPDQLISDYRINMQEVESNHTTAKTWLEDTSSHFNQ